MWLSALFAEWMMLIKALPHCSTVKLMCISSHNSSQEWSGWCYPKGIWLIYCMQTKSEIKGFCTQLSYLFLCWQNLCPRLSTWHVSSHFVLSFMAGRGWDRKDKKRLEGSVLSKKSGDWRGEAAWMIMMQFSTSSSNMMYLSLLRRFKGLNKSS